MRAFLLAQWLSIAGPASAAHDVAAGESLWSIARAHGCTVGELRAANPALVEPLQAGARLSLPTPPRAKVKRTVEPRAKPIGPTTMTPSATPAARPTRPRPRASTPGPLVHEVARGETLSSIAKRHGTTVGALKALNHLRSTTIVIGQRLALAEPTPQELPPVDVESEARTEDLPPPPSARFDLPPPPSDRSVRRGTTASTSAPATLVGAVQLPRDRAYYLRHPKRAWGLPHVVESTRAAVIAVKKKHPGVHRLAIGDLSAQRGGRLSGHKSHRNGRDVDVGLYFRRTPESYPQRFVGADAAPLDLPATWALIEAFYEQSKRAGGPVQIFLDYGVQGEIHDWARKHGVSKRVLREVFQYPHGRWARRGLVRHEPAHDDHLHVRFGDPPRSRRD